MQPNGRSNGEEFLQHAAGLRAADIPVARPVIFAGSQHEAKNRRHALNLGSVEYVSGWGDLMAVLERVLAATVRSCAYSG